MTIPQAHQNGNPLLNSSRRCNLR